MGGHRDVKTQAQVSKKVSGRGRSSDTGGVAGSGLVVVQREGGSWREKVTWGVHVGVGLRLRTRGCSSEFTGTRASALFGELSRDGGRGK